MYLMWIDVLCQCAGQCYVQRFHDNGNPGYIMNCKTMIRTPVMEMCVVLIVVLGFSQKLLFASAQILSKSPYPVILNNEKSHMNSLVKRHGNPVCSFFLAHFFHLCVMYHWHGNVLWLLVLCRLSRKMQLKKKMFKVKVLWTLKV